MKIKLTKDEAHDIINDVCEQLDMPFNQTIDYMNLNLGEFTPRQLHALAIANAIARNAN